MKRCFKCGTEKPLEDFYRHPMMGDGHLGKCKECTKRDAVATYNTRVATKEGRLSERARGRDKYHRLYRDVKRASHTRRRLDPVKRRARLAVQYAVRSGRLVKPNACSDCGGTENRIEAHHDDYGKPLDVKWLCSLCHGKRHRKAA